MYVLEKYEIKFGFTNNDSDDNVNNNVESKQNEIIHNVIIGSQS